MAARSKVPIKKGVILANEIYLTQAIIDNDENEVDRLLKDGNSNQWISEKVSKCALRKHHLPRFMDWTTPMCRSCLFSDVATMKKLVRAGASLYDINSEGHTALTLTCLFGTCTLEKVRYLLEKDKTLLHATNNKGFSPLQVASQQGYLDVCTYLLDKGARVNAGNYDGTTCLHLAAQNNHKAIIHLLHRHGANLRQRDKFENEPLHTAALFGASGALESLIDLGADIHALNKCKQSALHIAARSGSVVCIKLLIDRDVSVDGRDERKMTPLHVAALWDKVQCIDFLISNGAVVNALDAYGNSPLHLACAEGNLRSSEALQSYQNCDLTIKNNKGKTARALATDNSKKV